MTSAFIYIHNAFVIVMAAFAVVTYIKIRNLEEKVSELEKENKR